MLFVKYSLSETNEEKQNDIKELSPEDMDKTVYFRMVDVAKLAIDKKYTEEAEKNIEQEEKEITNSFEYRLRVVCLVDKHTALNRNLYTL